MTLRKTTRREFLGTAARVATGASLVSCFPDVGGRWAGELVACTDDGSPASFAPSARVVEIYDPLAVTTEPAIARDPDVILRMWREALTTLTDDAADAWQTLLPDYVSGLRIGLKVNCLNAQCATSVELVRAVVQSLRDELGIDPQSILVWDRRLDELARCGFTSEAVAGAQVVGTQLSTDNADGPGYEVDTCTVVDGKRAHLSRILTQMTDVTINCPVLKTHGVSGVTAGMKNIYGVIDNPGDFHGDLVTALPAIYALPPVQRSFRLTVVDALLAVTTGDTSSPMDTIAQRLLVGRDPVAVDSYAVALVNTLRAEKNIGLSDVRADRTAWLDVAEELGLGSRAYELIAVDASLPG